MPPTCPYSSGFMLSLIARLGGWSPPKRERPEQCDTTDAHRPCKTSCASMPTASSTDPHSFTVTSASGSASSLLGLTHASKRTCQHEFEFLFTTAAGHLHQHEQNLEASYRPAKMRKSETGTILGCMLLLSEPDIVEASRPCLAHQQATNSRSDTQPCSNKVLAIAGRSSPAPLPAAHAPACHLPAIHVLNKSLPAMPSPTCHVPSPHVLTGDTSSQVCTQLGSDSLFSLSGIAPEHAGCTVPTSCSAVAGLSPLSANLSVGSLSFSTVAPTSISAPHAYASPSACASPSAPATSSPCLLPSSASSLAVATARPPGAPSASALPSPDTPSVHANAVFAVSGPFASSGPSKRRLLFVPGPKLAKRLKLG